MLNPDFATPTAQQVGDISHPNTGLVPQCFGRHFLSAAKGANSSAYSASPPFTPSSHSIVTDDVTRAYHGVNDGFIMQGIGKGR